MSVLATILRMGIRRRSVIPTVIAAAVTAAAASGIAAAVVVHEDAGRAVDTVFADHNGPDLVVTTTFDEISAVQAMLDTDPRVSATAPPRRVIETRAETATHGVPLTINGIDSTTRTGALNAPILTAGRLPASPGEIAFDTAAARDAGISLGDTVAISTISGERPVSVVGLAYDLTDCFYPTCDPARAWVLDRLIPTLGADVHALLAVDVTDSELADAVGRDITQSLGDTTVRYNTWLDTRGDLVAESEFFGAFLAAFGLLALVASMVVIAGTITARTWSRRRALAQLRSLGSTRAQVTMGLLAEHILIAIVGIVIGNGSTALIAPRLRIGALSILDDTTPRLPGAAVVVSSVVVLVMCITATLLPSLRAGRADIVASIGAAPARTGRGSAAGRLLGAVPLPVPVDLGARSALVRPVRTVLATTAIALAIGTTVVAVSIDQTMDDLLSHPELTGKPADATLTPAVGISLDQSTRALEQIPEVASWYLVADTSANVDERSVHVRAIGGDPKATGYVIGDGAPLTQPGQAVAGYGLLDATGWHIGQTLHLEIHGQATDVTLVGWYRETEDSGALLQIRLEDLQQIDNSTTPQVAVHGAAGVTPRQLGSALTRAFGTSAEVVVREDDVGRLSPFRTALGTMTALVGFVALSNMIATATAASREGSRRTGTLRALGMTRRTCLAAAASHAMTVIVAAVPIGLLLGTLGAGRIGDTLTSQLGNGPGITHGLPIAQLATIATVVALIAALAAAVASRPTIARPIPDLLEEP